ncbi:unnamed protein product [Litomosoides sigmodontis]|uniref:SMODS and SLOG-associating 2TM effector domain-containing protein n=1 Tax=Litomosoides sigmodontis TaxID=42156 RepID=A0A3P6TNZ3_LITSI|nr:unnamed protein product [Litomosoides sigmodontis]
MSEKSIVNTIRLLENQKIERCIAFQEALDERKRAFELARLQYAYPYKAIASLAVTIISAVATYQHKNVFHLIPVAVALPYLACETDASFGRRTARIKRRADLLYRTGLAQHEPHILVADVNHRVKELQGADDME